jgi:hypothetical protein
MTDEQEFDIWYQQYPNKKSKGDARKAWAQTKSIRPTLQSMLEKLNQQCKSEDWRKDGGKFICYPATYLRSEKWDDEIEVTIAGVVAGKDWHETWQGISQKGKELGIDQKNFEHFYQFKHAVYEAARAQEAAPKNVFQLKSA